MAHIPRRLILALMLIGVVATAVLAWTEHRRPAPRPARLVSVDLGPVSGKLAAVESSTVESCHIEPLNGVTGARVVSIPLAGTRVRAGEIVVRLSDSKLESARTTAMQSLSSARRDVSEACDARDPQRRPPRRLDPLLRERVAEAADGERNRSLPLLDGAEACALARARARRASQAVAAANGALRALDLAAPIAGIVSEVNVVPGTVASDGPMLRITDDHCLLARAVFPRQVAPFVADGATACVQSDAASAAPACIGRISRIDASRSDSTIDVIVQLQALRAGMQLGDAVKVMVEATSGEAMRVSRDAVDGSPARPFVWKVDPDSGRVLRQPIEIGIAGRHHLQILSGARPGDQFAVAVEGRLVDGAEIVPTSGGSGK